MVVNVTFPKFTIPKRYVPLRHPPLLLFLPTSWEMPQGSSQSAYVDLTDLNETSSSSWHVLIPIHLVSLARQSSTTYLRIGTQRISNTVSLESSKVVKESWHTYIIKKKTDVSWYTRDVTLCSVGV